ncbi:MAG: hypothetical protein LBP95_11410, partial [Deltaproteobacteria bacterium]|nr:hypothetical protein [Deltaproteobacteria bacterium]
DLFPYESSATDDESFTIGAPASDEDFLTFETSASDDETFTIEAPASDEDFLTFETSASDDETFTIEAPASDEEILTFQKLASYKDNFTIEAPDSGGELLTFKKLASYKDNFTIVAPVSDDESFTIEAPSSDEEFLTAETSASDVEISTAEASAPDETSALAGWFSSVESVSSANIIVSMEYSSPVEACPPSLSAEASASREEISTAEASAFDEDVSTAEELASDEEISTAEEPVFKATPTPSKAPVSTGWFSDDGEPSPVTIFVPTEWSPPVATPAPDKARPRIMGDRPVENVDSHKFFDHFNRAKRYFTDYCHDRSELSYDTAYNLLSAVASEGSGRAEYFLATLILNRYDINLLPRAREISELHIVLHQNYYFEYDPDDYYHDNLNLEEMVSKSEEFLEEEADREADYDECLRQRQTALKLYFSAANKGHPGAFYKLAEFLGLNGYCRDVQAALVYFRSETDLGADISAEDVMRLLDAKTRKKTRFEHQKLKGKKSGWKKGSESLCRATHILAWKPLPPPGRKTKKSRRKEKD